MKSNVMVSVALLAIALSAGVPAGAVDVTHGIAATAVPTMAGTSGGGRQVRRAAPPVLSLGPGPPSPPLLVGPGRIHVPPAVIERDQQLFIGWAKLGCNMEATLPPNVARATVLAVLAVLAAAPDCAVAETQCVPQCVAAPEYTSGIEGPAVDAAGILYVMNLQQKGTIGKLIPGATQSELFATLPAGSIGNGARFDRDGRMYVADWKNHNVFVFERGQTVPRVYFHADGCSQGGPSPCFNQPNDLAVTSDGTLYASDPMFSSPSHPRSTGQIWRITRGPDGNGRGEVMSSSRHMGATNGLDLSPDGATLYVSESSTPEDCQPPRTARCVWAYRLDGATLTAPRLVKKFQGFDLDGLRTDLDGKIFVTRPENGTVAVLAPDGTLVREIPLRGKEPSNLTFGGPDGKTVFVTQGAGGFIEAFRVDRPGREPCLQAPDAC